MNRLILLTLLAAPLPLFAAATDGLGAAGERPAYTAQDCARLAGSAAPAGRSAADAAMLAGLPPLVSAQAARLRGAVGADVLWWLRSQGALNLSSLPTAYHEANHAIDVALAACHGGRAVYVFDGMTYVTELVRGSTAPYVVAAAAVPPAIKAGAAVRYQTYLVRTPKVPANDFTTLLDELNAYVGAAAIELALVDSPLYARFRADGNAALDGNIGGAADMMLYVLSYLKVVRTSYPDSYARIRNSPLLLAHLQRLWTAAEAMLKAAAPHGSEKGGLYVVPIAALVAVHSPAFMEELDRLKIRHQ
ncbi:hypothetical protein [Massilia sp. DWR3-1-1]|uniref:hypothetical protein n=1 Tax=Massilia sp. DWR3-1-1 TaxID=2804559 RepID=UPI003CF2549B